MDEENIFQEPSNEGGSCEKTVNQENASSNGGIPFSPDRRSCKIIKKAIRDMPSASTRTLDLSRKKLQYLTDDIHNAPNIEYLYLEGNSLSKLPDDFFYQLPYLIWLDLRNNQLTSLPSAIGKHRYLTTLLLEGNPIKQLPVELSNLTSLKALNLRHCPLEFPPELIVQQGLQSILNFLRSAMKGDPEHIDPSVQGLTRKLQQEGQAIKKKYKSMVTRHASPRKAYSEVWKQLGSLKMPHVEKLKLTELKSSLDVSEDWPNEEEMIRFEKLREEIIREDEKDIFHDQNQVIAPVSLLQTAEFGGCNRKPEKLIREPRVPSISRRRKVILKDTFPKLPPHETVIHRKKAEERRLAALKKLKEKQTLILQWKKDQEVLKEWREQTKFMQEKKKTEYDLVEPAKKDQVIESAPYATDPDYYRMVNSREQQNVHEQHERIRKILSGKSLKEIEEARNARDKKLEYRIRQHINMMQERRRKPKGTALEEMEAAKKELEIAEQLQNEVLQSKVQQDLPLEYRFTAFTGEILPSCSPTACPRNVFSDIKF
uniref:Leucine rich repeat containing 27 n=1 Tax=Latimeria chalumnae TaxID=7897 RepID=M3XHE5_LATCH|nr:PREDICTED: leucine-rich repeat-containing protein 27 isoform X3 [Latimeria chalumnae]XP_014346352.1 PREDICTED: leucine-rich repeat-containing protein 27 isoform X3 [Latimeria chalumnae]|eukprot:XP_014346351.1 PREDICTED: leucine-rich repeat-containing protein 27 isoform X3 [Latimeria chalumnae]